MPIYKGGQAQFGLHEAANANDRESEADFNGRVAADSKYFNIHSLNKAYKEAGEEFPIGGTGLAMGKQKKEKN
jgi:hypothetical protein